VKVINKQYCYSVINTKATVSTP